ncbi:hypothetical protein QUB33_16965 [Microcoleus sp. B3-A4]|uniref:hypothetical protein n=1 Tax=Microcoleus sp. B3-A4 TaxID=2818653 RepID=UPI002FD06F65
MSFTIQNALIPVDSGYETADVQVVDNCISAIAPNNPPSNSPAYQGKDRGGQTVIDGKNKLLLPGFVNAHTHSSEMWQRGIIPLCRWSCGLPNYTILRLSIPNKFI